MSSSDSESARTAVQESEAVLGRAIGNLVGVRSDDGNAPTYHVCCLSCGPGLEFPDRVHFRIAAVLGWGP